jgi:hypothetical protein
MVCGLHPVMLLQESASAAIAAKASLRVLCVQQDVRVVPGARGTQDGHQKEKPSGGSAHTEELCSLCLRTFEGQGR